MIFRRILIAWLVLPPVLALAKTPEDWTLYSTALYGQAGFLRVLSATKTPEGTLTDRGTVMYFSCPGLCGRDTFFTTTEGHERFEGVMAFTLAPDFDRRALAPEDGFEASFAYIGASHVVDDLDAQIKRPTISVGDAEFGLKYAIPRIWLPSLLHLAVSASGRMYTSLEDIGPKLNTFSPSARAMVTVDLLKYVPLQVHANAGYLLDHSMNIFDPTKPTPDRSRRFSQGVYGEDSLLTGLALSAPFKWVVPYVELFGWIDVDAKARHSSGVIVPIQSIRENPWTVTPGVRGYFFKRAAIEAGADLGFLSDRFPSDLPDTPRGRREDIVPPIRLFASLSYSFTPKMPKIVRRAPVGKIIGKVLDAESKQPLGFAVLSFPGTELPNIAADERSGEFTVANLAAGHYTLLTSLTGYESANTEVEIRSRQTTEVQVELKKLVTTAQISGSVRDPEGKPVHGLVFMHKEKEKVPSTYSTDPTSGDYQFTVPAGRYSVHAESRGFLPSEGQRAEIEAGQSYAFNFTLQPRPEPKLVKVTEDKIEILQTIHFETGRFIIKPISFPVLDEVGQILVENPNLRVRVEGHTDNVGGFQKNVNLSQGRADSVVQYLVGRGVASDRLLSVGLGPQFPIADNKTERGRAQNRRVEFIILSGKMGPAATDLQITPTPPPAPPSGVTPKWAVISADPFALVYEVQGGKAIARARKGRKMNFVQKDGAWIGIKLPSGKTGWLKETDATLE